MRLQLSVAVALGLATGGCAARPQPVHPPMTLAQADRKLQSIAQNPQMPQAAQAAAQQNLDENEAQRMLDQGH